MESSSDEGEGMVGVEEDGERGGRKSGDSSEESDSNASDTADNFNPFGLNDGQSTVIYTNRVMHMGE